MDVKSAFAKALKEFRLKKGLSQEALALDADMDRTYISLLERGMRQPSLGTIFTLCKILSCRPSELVARVETISKKGT